MTAIEELADLAKAILHDYAVASDVAAYSAADPVVTHAVLKKKIVNIRREIDRLASREQ